MAVLVIAEHNHAALTLRFILWSPLLKRSAATSTS